MPLKLLLALIWRSSAPPYATEAPARRWAALLDLPDPNTLGARRIKDALGRLEDAGLVALERRRGEPSIVTLRREDGSGKTYDLPSTAWVTATEKTRPLHFYFKVPADLWTSGQMQEMSASALAMLLAILAERPRPGESVWWATEEFPKRYGLSSSMRARGTSELEDRGLLLVQKRLIPDAPERPFGRNRVRNLYTPLGHAATALRADGPVTDVKPRPVHRRRAQPKG